MKIFSILLTTALICATQGSHAMIEQQKLHASRRTLQAIKPLADYQVYKAEHPEEAAQIEAQLLADLQNNFPEQAADTAEEIETFKILTTTNFFSAAYQKEVEKQAALTAQVESAQHSESKEQNTTEE